MTPLSGQNLPGRVVHSRRGSFLVPTTLNTSKIHRLAYFWPGLPQLWTRGSWAGLLVAVGFTALLNVLLLASLVFSKWLPLKFQLGGYGVLAVVWLLARWQSRAERRATMAVGTGTVGAGAAESEAENVDGSTETLPAERDTLFREAQGYYLRSDWVTTEQLLLKLLKQDSRDVESRLMLATLWRHQGRLAEARRQLDRVARLEAADHWENEIAAERMAISVAEQPDDETLSFSDEVQINQTQQQEAAETQQDDRPDTPERRAA